MDAVAAISRQPSALVGDGGEPERLIAYVVTPNVFDVLGATPMIGRAFGGDDGAPGAPRAIVLSHALWTRRFGADRSIVGRRVSVGGLQRTIVGVMPEGVRFPDASLDFLREPADLWIPSTFETVRNSGRGDQYLAVMVRRSAEATTVQSRADIDAVSARFRADFPKRYAVESSKNWRLVALPLRDQMVGSVRTGLLVISCAVGLVLLIACVNVANLLLARGATRQRELAIRLALGAARARVIRQLLTESVVLAVAGGVLGLLLALVGIRLLLRLDGGQLPRIADTHIDGAIVLFSVGLSLLTGLLVGVFPAVQQSAGSLRGALTEGTRGSGDGVGRHRLRVSLVVAQVAMALIILVGAGLLGRSFIALGRVDPGFSPDSVLAVQLTLPRSKYDSMSKVSGFYQQLVAAAAGLPGITEVSAGYPIPMSEDEWSGSFRVEGEPSGPNDPFPHAEYGVALPGYFHALRIPVLAGRDFSITDSKDAPSVVIVDEALARLHWPNQSAINKRINPNRNEGEWATVIGVVRHVHNSGPQAEGEGQIYLPYLQEPQSILSLVARSRGSAASLAQPLRALVRASDADLPISRIRPMSEFVSHSLAKQRFSTLLVAVFAFTALLLASVGLYGVMAYLVSQRTREIGIRMALGGKPSEIRAMVLREGILISSLGLAIGGAVALLVTRALRGLLFGIAPTDPVTYAGIAALLLVVGGIATYGPARRATRVDPLVALRQ